ncbi:MAG: MaoC family dehydratase [Bacteroidota bacterium]
MKIQEGQVYEEEFSFGQEEVDQFAKVSGDDNPIHIDAAYASETKFKKPIMHGFLAGSVFSRLIGTKFPGEGTVYLKQSMVFRRPMYVDVTYKAILTVNMTNENRHIAQIETKIIGIEDGKAYLTGEAQVMNAERI